MPKESIEKLGTEKEKEKSLDLELKNLSSEVRDLYFKNEELWIEKRRSLRILVNKKIESIKKEIKEDDPESLAKGLEKIAMTKFLYLWQPGMYNHTTKVETRMLREGLISPKFARRAKLGEVKQLWRESTDVSVYKGTTHRKRRGESVYMYLWGSYWYWKTPSSKDYIYRMGFIVDPILESKEYGELLEPVFKRIAPRFFLGMLVSLATDREQDGATLSEREKKEYKDRLSRWVCEENIYRDRPELVVPFVSKEGDLLWPKNLDRLQVLSMVGDKEDKAFAKEKIKEKKKK